MEIKTTKEGKKEFTFDNPSAESLEAADGLALDINYFMSKEMKLTSHFERLIVAHNLVMLIEEQLVATAGLTNEEDCKALSDELWIVVNELLEPRRQKIRKKHRSMVTFVDKNKSTIEKYAKTTKSDTLILNPSTLEKIKEWAKSKKIKIKE